MIDNLKLDLWKHSLMIWLAGINILTFFERNTIMWTKPQATEMRFGFEITLYVMNK